MNEPTFYVAGGTLRQDAQSYVARGADDELLSHLQRGEFCYVLTSRQMGKSSLMVRTAAQLREKGCAVVVIDLTRIGQNLDVDQWYYSMLIHVGEQLKLEEQMEAYWDEHERDAPLNRFMGAIRECYLERKRKPLVLFVDEIDYVRSLQKFSADEFFAGIRECYNRRPEDPKMTRLTFCLLGVTTPSELIRDQRLTPFNIGRGIELHDFTQGEAAVLADGLSPHRETAHQMIQRVLYWTNGHPYLTQRLCSEAVKAVVYTPSAIDQVCESIFLSAQARERDDNLHFVRERLLNSHLERAALLDCYIKVCRGEKVADDHLNPVIGELRLTGIVSVKNGYLEVRNEIYRRVFDLKWAKINLPDAEIRRQKEAFHRGVRRVAGVSLLVMLAMGVLVFFAVSAQRHAKDAQRRAEDAAIESKQALLDRGEALERARQAAEKTTKAAEAAKKAAEGEAEANRNRLAEAEKTKEALQQKEKALEESKAALAMLSENLTTIEALLTAISPSINQESDKLLELAERLARNVATEKLSLDPKIRLSQAGLCAMCSQLFGRLRNADKAKTYAEIAQNIVTELLKATPDAREYKLRLYDFQSGMGDVLFNNRLSSNSANDAILEPYQKARDLAKQEYLAKPEDREWANRYVAAQSRIGDVLASLGSREQAEEHFRQAEQEVHQVLSKAPNYKQSLAALKDRLGNLYLFSGAVDKARKEFEESFKIRKEGLDGNLPPDPDAQADLATSFNKLGNVFLANGQWSEALKYHQESLKIRQPLHEKSPTEERSRNYGYSLNNTAKALWRNKRDGEAADLYKKRYDLAQRMVAGNRSEENLRDLSNAIFNYADILLNADDARVKDKDMALDLAKSAVDSSGRKDARYLALYAQCLRLSKMPEAASVALEAQALLPPEDKRTAEDLVTAKEIAYEIQKNGGESAAKVKASTQKQSPGKNTTKRRRS